MNRVSVECEVNGRAVAAEVEPRMLLSELLREACAATSVHIGCGQGICGACTVLLDGRTRRSCTTLAASVQGRRVETLEGLSDAGDRVTRALQAAFISNGGLQCGFCTPGMLLAARELLAENPTPDRDAIREALAGNFCRCTGYGPIVDAVEEAAKELVR